MIGLCLTNFAANRVMNDIIKYVTAKTTSSGGKVLLLVKRMKGITGDVCYTVTNLVNSTQSVAIVL